MLVKAARRRVGTDMYPTKVVDSIVRAYVKGLLTALATGKRVEIAGLGCLRAVFQQKRRGNVLCKKGRRVKNMVMLRVFVGLRKSAADEIRLCANKFFEIGEERIVPKDGWTRKRLEKELGD